MYVFIAWGYWSKKVDCFVSPRGGNPWLFMCLKTQGNSYLGILQYSLIKYGVSENQNIHLYILFRHKAFKMFWPSYLSTRTCRFKRRFFLWLWQYRWAIMRGVTSRYLSSNIAGFSPSIKIIWGVFLIRTIIFVVFCDDFVRSAIRGLQWVRPRAVFRINIWVQIFKSLATCMSYPFLFCPAGE